MRINYKLQDKFDLWLLFSALILICIGLVAIYSSTVNHPTASGNFEKQLIWAIISLVVFFITFSVPSSTFKVISIPVYLISILLLIAVLFLGKTTGGARSWINFGPFGFQPSEFAKIGTILAMANFLSKKNINIDSFIDILKILAIGIVPVVLILLEPDMGTALIFAAFILTVIFWSGISLFGLFIVLSPGFVALVSLFGTIYLIVGILIVTALLFVFRRDIFYSGAILALNIGAGFFADYVYKALSPHQQKRIQSFLDPMADPLGAGYNAIQAKVAIGSGGFTGKGFLQGNQTQLQFIPEQWTDFIYCVIGEEFGFIGTFVTLSIFLYLILRILKIASLTKDEFLSLTSIGILAVFFSHLFINVGMTIGVMPIIGIPLPFVSYGGSSLLVNMFMLGIIANIYRTRKDYT